MTEQPIVEGTSRRPLFPGNRKRSRPGDPLPPLEFGPYGEFTPKTIKQAGLTPAEEKRAFEILQVQAAYLEILNTLSYPVDPEGHVHDLSALGPTKIAIAWTLALAGARFSGEKYIKKRSYGAVAGMYPDAHTWVDARSPDDAAEELRPEHRADDPDLPPDTCRLAALRDNTPPPELPDEWRQQPEIVYVDKPRKEGM